MDWLQPAAREGITGVGVARLQSFAEPGHPLFRGAMRPAFRLDIALSHLLEPVVPDGGSGFQPCFEITRLDTVFEITPRVEFSPSIARLQRMLVAA